jgi:phosphatidate cytidylyltransferase
MEPPADTPSIETSADAFPPAKEGKFAALPARIASALALIIIAGSAWYAGGIVWIGFIGICAAIMLYEWFNLTKDLSNIWQIAGIAYVGLPCTAIYLLQLLKPAANLPLCSQNSNFIIPLIVMVAATDIGAYFSGKLIGGAKLAPRISPNKTWAGLIGGSACAAIASYGFHHDLMGTAIALSFGVAVAILGQTGDIFESALKRRAGVKDSGKILPGHGGLLDRFDGLTLTAPLYLNVMIYAYGAIFP